MNSTAGSVSTAEFAAVVSGLLDAVHHHDLALLPDHNQLDLVAELLQVQPRLTGVVHTVLGAVDRAEAALTAHGVPTASWLAGELRYTRPQACAMVHQAADLHRFGQLADALRDGRINDRQAVAVTGVLRKLPDDLGPDAERRAEATMVGFCATFDSHQLSALAHHVLEVVAPEIAQEAEAARIERKHRQARRDRHLNFTDDGRGSTIVRRSLPAADAALRGADRCDRPPAAMPASCPWFLVAPPVCSMWVASSVLSPATSAGP